MSSWRIPLAITLIAIMACLLVQHAVMEKQTWTIKEARRAHLADGTVVVKGKIVYAADNRFLLDDGTGIAEVFTCPTWYKRIDLYEGQDVTVVAEVINHPSTTAKCDLVLSAYKIFVNGRTIPIRSRPGKPPWMVCTQSSPSQSL